MIDDGRKCSDEGALEQSEFKILYVTHRENFKNFHQNQAMTSIPPDFLRIGNPLSQQEASDREAAMAIHQQQFNHNPYGMAVSELSIVKLV